MGFVTINMIASIPSDVNDDSYMCQNTIVAFYTIKKTQSRTHFQAARLSHSYSLPDFALNLWVCSHFYRCILYIVMSFGIHIHSLSANHKRRLCRTLQQTTFRWCVGRMAKSQWYDMARYIRILIEFIYDKNDIEIWRFGRFGKEARGWWWR